MRIVNDGESIGVSEKRSRPRYGHQNVFNTGHLFPARVSSLRALLAAKTWVKAEPSFRSARMLLLHSQRESITDEITPSPLFPLAHRRAVGHTQCVPRERGRGDRHTGTTL